MIYTLTSNPSLDVKISLGHFTIVPGGKGINISTILSKQNIASTAFSFVGGRTGKYLTKNLENNIIKDFVDIKDKTRINYKLKLIKEYERNGKGPLISNKEKEELFNKLSKLNENDVLIISGSVPYSIDDSFYEEIVSRLKGTKFVVDARKGLLLKTLKYGPELIKPNIHELKEIFNEDIKIEDVRSYARKLLDMGAKRVLVSLGKDGLIYVSKTSYIYKEAGKGKVISSTGAGDALVTGFVLEYLNSKDEIKAVDKALEFANKVVFEGYLL